jgi:hypothetical protein
MLKAAEQKSQGSDSQDLEKLGYAQELLRTMGGFSNFAISFSIISILTGAVTLYDYGLSMGGPLEMTLGWPLVTVGTLLVALSMAELSSALPTSGAMYHWSAELGGPTWAWFTAWFNIIGLVTVIVGIDYGCARFLVPILGFPSKNSTILLVYGLILLSHGLINHYGVRWVARLNDISVAVHILGVVILMAALWFFAPKRPLVFLLQASPTDPPIHAPYAWLFVLGLLQAQWTYTGFDGSAHIAEETVDPRRRAPWGMVMAVVVSGIFGYLLVLSLAWVIPDLRQALSTTDASGNTIPAVLDVVLRHGVRDFALTHVLRVSTRQGHAIVAELEPHRRAPDSGTGDLAFGVAGLCGPDLQWRLFRCDLDQRGRLLYLLRHPCVSRLARKATLAFETRPLAPGPMERHHQFSGNGLDGLHLRDHGDAAQHSRRVHHGGSDAGFVFDPYLQRQARNAQANLGSGTKG